MSVSTAKSSTTNNGKSSFQGIIPDFCQLQRSFVLVLLSILLALVFTLMTFQPGQSIWFNLGLHALFTVWVSLVAGALLCLTRQRLNQLSVVRVTLVVTLMTTLLTLLSSLIAIQLFYYISFDTNYLSFDWSHRDHLWIMFRNSLVAALITLVWMRYLYLRQQVMKGLVAEGEARFRSLQARIQPHFLFNTLNTIASLIDINPKAAESTLEHLATLLRSSLKATTDNIPLQQEIELCQHYLAIEQQRLGKKLKVDWQIEVDTTSYALPALTLQPLVENAVYHGIQRLPKGGVVTVIIRESNDGLLCQVINPIPNRAARPGNQTAQSNIQQRLSIRYGESATMKVQSNDDLYQVELFLPNEVNV